MAFKLIESAQHRWRAVNKVWDGPAKFGPAVNQLLNYLVWRDGKSAIVLFIKTGNPTEVVRKADQVVANHAQCVRRFEPAEPTVRIDNLLRSTADPERTVRTAMLPVAIAPPPSVAPKALPQPPGLSQCAAHRGSRLFSTSTSHGAVRCTGTCVVSGSASDRAHAAGDREAASTDRAMSARERAAGAIDALTGARRRDAGMVELAREVDRTRRSRTSLVLVFIDVDGLKATNDALGHAAGDDLLRRVVLTVRSYTRPYDLIVRLGGDEFVCAFPGVSLVTATERFSLIHADLASSPPASISTGLAELTEDDSLEDLMDRADAANEPNGSGGQPPAADGLPFRATGVGNRHSSTTCWARVVPNCNHEYMAAVARLVTAVDVDGDSDSRRMSVSARYVAELVNGHRVPLLLGRGWSSSLETSWAGEVPDGDSRREDIPDIRILTLVEDVALPSSRLPRRASATSLSGLYDAHRRAVVRSPYQEAAVTRR